MIEENVKLAPKSNAAFEERDMYSSNNECRTNGLSISAKSSLTEKIHSISAAIYMMQVRICFGNADDFEANLQQSSSFYRFIFLVIGITAL